MLKRDDLLSIRTAYQLIDEKGMSIAVLEDSLKGLAGTYEVPLSWERDQIENASGAKEAVQDCLVLFHPDHKDDYYRVVVEFEAPTKLAVLTASIVGSSENGVLLSGATALIQGGKMALANFEGLETGAADEEAYNAELDYYSDLYAVINALIGASQV